MRPGVELTASRVVRGALTHRVVVRFPGLEGLELEYAATDAEAWEFATAAALAGIRVRVDRRVRAGLRPLPCRSLWQ
ncbi:hypothetical protein VMT65_38200 [Nocardia sp. CDC153]|uniref:hypothetical protein n=1 Tax=Nocardia sp. CDC153 TaxID=3112167 RepID=UPI002DB5A04B|nr:hypothetical protein [Nocardia sp. CDC153]MEC3958919.1 hypothetical protein [Nocardia sp. CDC153]